MYKHYGGISFFEGKPPYLLAKCLENAVKKEQEIPKIILECFNLLRGNTSSLFSQKINKKMRSKEDIEKDYGLR